MRPTFARLATAVAAALVACGGDGATKPRIDPVDTTATQALVSASISAPAVVNPTQATWPNATIPVTVGYSPSTLSNVQISCTVDGIPVTLCSGVTASIGKHVIKAAVTASGVTKVDSVEVVVAAPLIIGQIAMADGSSCPTGTMVFAGENKEDATQVHNDCTFSLPTKFALGDTVVFRAIDPSARMKDFFGRVPKRYFSSFNIVGIPAVWTIKGDLYGGAKITVDLEAAYAPPAGSGEVSGFYTRGRQVGKPWKYTVGSYPRAIPTLACTTALGTMSADDSASFWSFAAVIQQIVGRVVFAASSSQTACTGPIGSIELKIAGGTHAGGSFGAISGRDFSYGSVNARTGDDFHNGGTVRHEIGHVLSFGHTNSWASVMWSSSTFSLEDVAYIQLMDAVAAAERTLNTRLSLPQAHQGERVKKFGASAEEPVDVYEPVAP
ncbi:MAG: hypothetical protein JWN89_545 [Parcubacteria group bacterium]|nr:hypothetical protein [Parcubacteria group bacterium]